MQDGKRRLQRYDQDGTIQITTGPQTSSAAINKRYSIHFMITDPIAYV